MLKEIFETSWSMPYGPPEFLMCDAGGKNLGQDIIDSFEKQGVEVMDAAGEVHDQAGHVERHGGWFEDILEGANWAIQGVDEQVGRSSGGWKRGGARNHSWDCGWLGRPLSPRPSTIFAGISSCQLDSPGPSRLSPLLLRI
jgi:hypothetical protein